MSLTSAEPPAARVPGLAREDLAQGQSLYGLLRERHGIVPTPLWRSIGIGQATEEEAGVTSA